MNNFLLKKILYCLVLLLLTCIITLSLSIPDHIKWELTGLYFTIGIITIALFYILQKNNLSGSIINLTTKRNKILLNTLSPISIILSIYLIPIQYFPLSAILILLSIIASILMQKILVINQKGIRYIMHWDLKWSSIDCYNFDKKNGILHIQQKNGKHKQIIDISSESHLTIQININKYFNKSL